MREENNFEVPSVEFGFHDDGKTSEQIEAEVAELIRKRDAIIAQQRIQQSQSKNKYYRINSGMIIKIDTENLMCYKFDTEKRGWIPAQHLFVEFEQGNIHGQFIEFNDQFPTYPAVDQSKGIKL